MRFLGLIVILSPLPFGANRPWAWSLISLLTGALAIAWWVSMVRGGHEPPIALHRVKWIAAPYALVLSWSLFQAYAPVPDFMAHGAWPEASKVLGLPLARRISVDPEATKTAFMKLASYGAVFYLSLQLCASRRRARELFTLIAASATFYSLYGLVVYFYGLNSILWYDVDELTSGNFVRATFVYHNSFAIYAGFALLCLTALISEEAANMAVVLDSREMTPRQKGQISIGIFPHVISFFILFSGLLLSQSRAGFSAVCAAMALYVSYQAHAMRRAVGFYLVVIPLLAMTAMVYHFSGHTLEIRMKALEKDVEERMNIYGMTTEGIMEAPWTGVGHGTFEDAIRAHSRADYPFAVNAAHNVYLESAMELGIPAAALLCASILLAGRVCATGAAGASRSWPYSAAGASAVALAALHSLFDFSMQAPAVAVTFAAIVGAACARSLHSADRRGK